MELQQSEALPLPWFWNLTAEDGTEVSTPVMGRTSDAMLSLLPEERRSMSRMGFLSLLARRFRSGIEDCKHESNTINYDFMS